MSKKENNYKNLTKNIEITDKFLTKEEQHLFLKYLETTTPKERLNYLHKLKDIYTLQSILTYREKKATYQKIYKIIAEENNLSQDYKKNKKLFSKYLKLSKYSPLKEEIQKVNTKYQDNKSFLIALEKLIKTENKISKKNKHQNKEETEDYITHLTNQTSINKEELTILNNILNKRYQNIYKETLTNIIPQDLNNYLNKLEISPYHQKEEKCLLWKDILKNYLKTIPKEDTIEKNFIKQLINIFDKYLTQTEYQDNIDTTPYYNILISLLDNDQNYETIKSLIEEIEPFKYAKTNNHHILFYLLDEFINNYKIKLVNQGIKYIEPTFYKEIIKLILKNNNPLSEIETYKFQDIIQTFEDYCKKRKYISMSTINKDLSEINKALTQEEQPEKINNQKLEKELSILKLQTLPNIINYYKKHYPIITTNETFTFMIEKIPNYAFSIKYQKEDIILNIHLLDTSKLINKDNELIKRKELLPTFHQKSLYPTISFNYHLNKNNHIYPLRITPTLLKIDNIFKEKDLINESSIYLKDTITILNKLNERTNIKTNINTSKGIEQIINQNLSNDLKDLFQKIEIPFIYITKQNKEELITQNHNLTCELLSKLSKEEAHKIFNILEQNQETYYTLENNETSKIELNTTTLLGIYLLSTINKIQEGKYNLEEELENINKILTTLNTKEYTPYQIINQNNKYLRKVLNNNKRNIKD